MQKTLTFLLSAILLITFSSVAIAAPTDISPNKTEYIQSNGITVPVFYFDDNGKAKKFMEERKHLREITAKNSAVNNNFSAKAAADYAKYLGARQYEFTNTFMSNNTNAEQSMATTVTKVHTSKVSITVTADIAKFFKVQVGYDYTNTYQYANTFNIKVPAKKKGLITTYNLADLYDCKLGAKTFTVWRPTATEGAEIYIVALSFPES